MSQTCKINVHQQYTHLKTEASLLCPTVHYTSHPTPTSKKENSRERWRWPGTPTSILPISLTIWVWFPHSSSRNTGIQGAQTPRNCVSNLWPRQGCLNSKLKFLFMFIYVFFPHLRIFFYGFERERKNIDGLPLLRALTGHRTHNLSGVWDDAPADWATQPGPKLIFF